MWIQVVRYPKKAWIEMHYCITKEEVDWIIKEWHVNSQLPVSKPTTRPITIRSSRPKDKVEVGSTTRTYILVDNTRMNTTQNQPTGSSAILKISRRTTTETRTGSNYRLKINILHSLEKKVPRVKRVGCIPHRQ